MTTTKKRLSSLFLSFSLAVSAITYPVRSFALLPAAPIVAPIAAELGLTGSLYPLAGAIGALAVGEYIKNWVRNRGNDGQPIKDPNGNPKPLEKVPTSPANEPAAPAGWPSPNQPPSAVAPTYSYYFAEFTGSAMDEVASKFCSVAYGGTATRQSGANNFGYYDCNGGTAAIGGQGFGPVRWTRTCPSGYEYDGVACFLTQPDLPKWPSDGQPSYKPDGSPQTRDPDNGVNPQPLPGYNPAKNTIMSESGVTPEGYPIAQSITANPATQTTTVAQAVQNPNGDTATVTRVDVDPDGRVTNIQQQVVPVTQPVTQIVQQITGTSASTGSGTGSITIPDDYARENTSQSIRDRIKDILDWLLQPLTPNTSIQQETASRREHADSLEKFFDTTNFNANNGISFSFAPAIPVSSCAPFDIPTYGDKKIRFDICDKVDMVRDFNGWVFYLLTGLSVFNIATRRGEE